MTSRYMIQPASAMRRYPDMIPDEPGLYALVLDHPEALARALAAARLALEPVRLGHRQVLYIGATGDSLRRRLKHHLSDDTTRSTFRMSAGALLMEELGLTARRLPGQRHFGFEPDSEAILSRWIADHVSVAWRPHAKARETEARLIRKAHPPMNIAGRGGVADAAIMARLRRRCGGLGFDQGTLN